MTFYAYSAIKYGDGVIKLGEKVDQKALGIDDDEWEGLIADQAIGEEPLPDDLADTESFAQYNLRQAKEDYEAAQAGEIVSARKTSTEKTKDESAPSKPQ